MRTKRFVSLLFLLTACLSIGVPAVARESKFARDLRKACERDNQKRLRKVLDSVRMEQVRSEINTVMDSKPAMTPLFLAIRAGSVENVKILLQYGADPNCMRNDPEEVFQILLEFSDPDKAKAYLHKRKMKGLFYHEAVSPLIFIARAPWFRRDESKAAAMLQLLLDADADPNWHDPLNTWTPIMFFIDSEQSDCVRLMLDCNLTNLDYLLREHEPGKNKIDGVRTIAQMHSKQPAGQLVLRAMADPDRIARVKKARVKKAAFVPKPTLSMTAAITQNNIEEVQRNLAAMPDINAAVNKLGQTPLILAVRTGSPECVKTILEGHPVLSVKDSSFGYAFLYAMRRKDDAILSLLRKAGGALLPCRDIHEAVMQDRDDELERLIDQLRTGKLTELNVAFNLAAAMNKPAVFAFLLTQKINPIYISSNMRFSSCEPAPFHMIANGEFDFLKSTLKLSFPRDVRHSRTGASLLGFAVDSAPDHKLDYARLLLDAGVDVNQADRDGRTPLMLAALKGDFELVRFLIDRSASVTLKDSNNRTVKDYALWGKNLEITDFLQGNKNNK